MAENVVTFDASRRRSARSLSGGVAGEILVFSGVRYERRSASGPEPISSGGPNDPVRDTDNNTQ